MKKQVDEFRPDWVSPPGESIAELLHSKQLSAADLAASLNESTDFVSDVINAKAVITDDLAAKLAAFFGASREFWILRERRYRESLAEFEHGQKLLEHLPIRDMIDFGWIANVGGDRKNLLRECLNFFEIKNPLEWKPKYQDVIEKAAFRTTPTFDSSTGSVAAWLRRGEVEAEAIDCDPWNPAEFREVLRDIRELTRLQDPSEFLGFLKSMCAKCGVAVVILRAPNRCRASGATRFISPEKAMLLLSFRYLSDDHFWFTFFHEAAHLVLHSDRNLFVDSVYETTSKDESEANEFAGEVLIPSEARTELPKLGSDPRAVIRFARKIGISRGIVVGQMQHLGLIRRNQLNNLKSFYSWS